MTVCVVGLGYIGLPTAALIATLGTVVRGVDISKSVIDAINRGTAPRHEPDLDVLVRSAVHSGNLTAHLEPAPADVFIIAVPTPADENHRPVVTAVEAAALAIAPHLKPSNLVIVESTVPVGTSKRVAELLLDARPDLTVGGDDDARESNAIYIAHCPERVLPGRILKELVENDRIVGGLGRRAAQRAHDFYRTFVNGNIHLTDTRSAELAKLVENAYRDVNIAFANELSLVCNRHGLDVWEVIELANRHPRVSILNPGPGVGGHCIAVDPWFIVAGAPKDTLLIDAARRVNDSMPDHVVARIHAALAATQGGAVACLGLSYKANVDDLRESPALRIVELLAESKTEPLLVVEPHITTLPASLQRYGNVRLTALDSALQQAAVVVLLVDHRPFRNVDAERLRGKQVVDTRGLWRTAK